MAQVGAEIPRAARTGALLVDGARVVSVPGLFDADSAQAGQRLSVSGVPGGEHAVEHVDAGADGAHDVAGCADAHQVTGPLGVEAGRHRGERLVHAFHRLADGETPEREAVERQRAELVGVSAPKIGETAPCTMPKSACPSGRGTASARFAHRVVRARRLRRPRAASRPAAHVELHLDVGAEKGLDAHGPFRRQKGLGAIDVGFRRKALLGGVHE